MLRRGSPGKSVLFYVNLPSWPLHLIMKKKKKRSLISWLQKSKYTWLQKTIWRWGFSFLGWVLKLVWHHLKVVNIFVGLYLLLECSETAAKLQPMNCFDVFCINSRKICFFTITCFSRVEFVNIMYFFWSQTRLFKFFTLPVSPAVSNTLNIT